MLHNEFTNEDIIKMCDENPDGFTMDILEGGKVKHGFAVAMTHGIKPRDFGVMVNVYQDLAYQLYENEVDDQPQMALGGFRQDDEYIVDFVIIIHDRDEALRIGRMYEQDSIYDLDNNLIVGC
jgi:hypothetical protein